VPYNVFDLRIESRGWLARLIDAGSEVHVRTAFLQGLLLMPQGSWPTYFQPWTGLLEGWLNWCEANGVPPACGALQHAIRLAGVSSVVIGIDSAAQLDELVGMLGRKVPNVPAEFQCDDEMLVNPARWVRS
jgi:aryl-alcohol dehydrogenase-like predicted oxidoreductase